MEGLTFPFDLEVSRMVVLLFVAEHTDFSSDCLCAHM